MCVSRRVRGDSRVIGPDFLQKRLPRYRPLAGVVEVPQDRGLLFGQTDLAAVEIEQQLKLHRTKHWLSPCHSCSHHSITRPRTITFEPSLSEPQSLLPGNGIIGGGDKEVKTASKGSGTPWQRQ